MLDIPQKRRYISYLINFGYWVSQKTVQKILALGIGIPKKTRTWNSSDTLICGISNVKNGIYISKNFGIRNTPGISLIY